MKATKNEKIKIGIPEKIINDLRTIYGNTIDIDAKIEEVLRNFIDTRNALEPMLQPDLDAHATDDEEDGDVFCAHADVFPDNPGILNPNPDDFPVEWNGNHTMNILRARAQACFLLDICDYSGLGRRVMDGILSIVENKQKNFVEEWKP